jgi:hypothetical protein
MRISKIKAHIGAQFQPATVCGKREKFLSHLAQGEQLATTNFDINFVKRPGPF